MKKLTLAGIDVVVPTAPPADFDPLTAGAQTLKKHGFPPLPEDPRHLARYRQVFGRVKDRATYIEPTFRVHEDRFHGPRRRDEQAGAETSSNWSGGVVFAPAGDTFKWVQGDWVVPDVYAPTENQWYYCASWIGLDGDGSGDVFQAGIECEAYRVGSAVTLNVYPWWEWYPIPEVAITNFPVSPGDLISVLLCSSQGAGSTTGTVYFTNRVNGASTSVSMTAPNGTSLIGNSAEWVVEAPTVGGAQSTMADYGQVFFDSCAAVTTTAGSTVDGGTGGTGDSIDMVGPDGKTVVSHGILVTDTVIECVYEG